MTQPIQAGPPAPNRTRSTSATVASGHPGCSRAASGVAAVRVAKTSRNHSGDHTSLVSVFTVATSAPRASIEAATRIQTAVTAATGRSRRAIRVPSQRP
ncbi:hypothetical protein ABZ260_44355 [Streptosporangium sp. NPDC006013]|uniref:hypothetical protein n=1 Tax=Streptosporangium sp. NPDC006013 TaxID=3155596 RepID=UPI0033B5C784